MNTPPLHSEAANELYDMLLPELRAELARFEQARIVPAGFHLINCGVPQEHLVIVNAGKVEITLDCNSRHAASLGYSGAGKVFGMRALVSGELPEIDVTCMESCSITTIPRDVFLAVLKDNPQVYFAVAKVLSSDLQIADRILRGNTRRCIPGPRPRPAKIV
jgi:CRP-like cAMP-binding protein